MVEDDVKSQDFPNSLRWSVSNFQVKHNVRKRPLVSSSQYTTTFKGIRVDSLAFSQVQIVSSYAFPMESLFAHSEKSR